ncbi:ABC transporter permease [Shewanella sp. 6_MG-2023]|uniref:ABC transporter permease n=1 Tax=Shewanella sp. 6_MG-2023 TaxID=3062660 RepID=UPI0026E16FBB|nr:ABC transporter permease [Shewanella sp. 6_MG-2023]MDO6617599.1 ABC transporter permease [Shewanella sp. 6_MG-2023]
MAAVIKRNNWQIWRDVIFALFVREIRTGFNDKFGIAWAVVSPVAFIFILSYMRGRMDGGETHTIPSFTFMAIGMLLVQFFLEVLAGASSAIKKNKALFAFRQVQPLSSIIASALFQLLVKLFVFICIGIIMFFIGIEIRIDNPMAFLANVFLLWLIAISIGSLFGLAACYVPEVSKIQLLMTRPLFFISGVFFSLQDMPKELWQYFDWNPILHAIELSRYAVYSSYGSEGVSEVFLSLSALVSVFVALSCYFVTWKQAISR